MQTIKFIFFIFLSVAGSAASAGVDLSLAFKQIYQNDSTLQTEEQRRLKEFNIYLVPGLLSETFLSTDERSKVDLSFMTGDYFGEQKNMLRQKFGFSVERLSSSSQSVREIRNNIQKALDASQRANRKALFITHSLGGLALLEELLLNEESQSLVAGIIFLQSPFNGTPIADIYLENRYYIKTWIQPLMPFFNTSDETLRYLSTASRVQFMNREKEAIRELVSRIPVITLGGAVNGYKSLFQVSTDVMAYGCVRSPLGCVTPALFQGPYVQSDGMVPFESSKLEQADFIKLEGVDHGETVVNIPFENYKKENLTLTLLKLILPKLGESRR